VGVIVYMIYMEISDEKLWESCLKGDKEAFREATAEMIDEYREEYPGVADLLDRIDGIREEEE